MMNFETLKCYKQIEKSQDIARFFSCVQLLVWVTKLVRPRKYGELSGSYRWLLWRHRRQIASNSGRVEAICPTAILFCSRFHRSPVRCSIHVWLRSPRRPASWNQAHLFICSLVQYTLAICFWRLLFSTWIYFFTRNAFISCPVRPSALKKALLKYLGRPLFWGEV